MPDCRRLDFLNIDPCPVVRHRELHLAAIHGRHGDRDRGARRLAGGGAPVGRLDAVIDGIPQQMDEWILEILEDALVDRDVLAPDHQLRLLALIAAEIPHQLGKRGRAGGERKQQQLLGVLQQVVDEPLDHVAVLLCGPREPCHMSFERLDVVGTPIGEVEQPRQRRTVHVPDIAGRGADGRLAERARLRFHCRPLVFPRLESVRKLTHVLCPLRRGELGREKLLSLHEHRVELRDPDAHGVARCGAAVFRGERRRGRLLRDRRDGRRTQGSGDRAECPMRRVDRSGSQETLLPLPAGEEIFEQVALRLDVGEADRARRALETVRGAEYHRGPFPLRCGRG